MRRHPDLEHLVYVGDFVLAPVLAAQFLADDFLNGVTYSVDGQIKKVAVNTYILTPSSVDVTEDEDEKQGLVTE